MAKKSKEVSKWHSYGLVKGDHVKWAKYFRKTELSEINESERALVDTKKRWGLRVVIAEVSCY